MGKREIEVFLSHLATTGNVSAATQRQAMHALLFLYREVLDRPMEDQIEAIKAKKRRASSGAEAGLSERTPEPDLVPYGPRARRTTG